MSSYCPKCGSLLFPGDEESIEATGICSYCTTYDKTPDKRFQKRLSAFRAERARQEHRKRKIRRRHSDLPW